MESAHHSCINFSDMIACGTIVEGHVSTLLIDC